MKKIIAAILLVSVIWFGTIKLVNADEVEDTSSTSSPVTETTNENASDLEIWFEENLGWLVGIPTGTLITAIIEFIVLVKKSKKKSKEIVETEDLNKKGKLVLDTAKELLSDTKSLTTELKTSVTEAVKKANETDLLVNEKVTLLTNELSSKLSSGLETLNNTLVLLENRIGILEETQEMIALHTKELVACGTAEEISKKIRG